MRTYPTDADGNVPPDILLAGPKTLLNEPQSPFVRANGALWTCNLNGAMLGFPPGAHGNEAPMVRIGGTNNPVNLCFAMTVAPTGRLAEVGISSPAHSVFIWRAGSKGNVKPTWIIHGDATKLNFPKGLAFDAAGNLFVTGGTVAATARITVYAHNANGNVAPLRMISGHDTKLSDPRAIAIGPSGGRIYVADHFQVLAFRIGARGDAKPVVTITGPQTGLSGATGLAFDSAGFLYVSNNHRAGYITVYKPGANGDQAPVRTIKGSNVSVQGFISVR